MYHIETRNFNLDYTLSCGQVFRWEKKDWWTGVVNGAVLRVRQEGSKLIINSSRDKKFMKNYFRIDDDLENIYASISRDDIIASLIEKYRGLRLIRQEPWECLVSYICSSNNNIRRITTSIKRMCECFGRDMGDGYHSFPTPEALVGIELCDMERCKLGYRASSVLNVASMVADGEFDLYGIGDLPYRDARKELLRIQGVGTKIADCVLLFAFGKLESFPVDTHIEHIMEQHYGKKFNGPKSRKKEEIAEFARRYFGKYCGYAQEYLYLEDLGQITQPESFYPEISF